MNTNKKQSTVQISSIPFVTDISSDRAQILVGGSGEQVKAHNSGQKAHNSRAEKGEVHHRLV